MTKAGGIIGVLAAFALAPLLLAASAPSADASSSTCRQLERQLVKASRAGSSRYSAAIRRQQRELDNAERRQRAARCGGIKSLFGNSECRRVGSVIRKMRSNLSRLEAKARRGGSRAELARIRALLSVNGCRGGSGLRTARLENDRGFRELGSGSSRNDRSARRRVFGGDQIGRYSGTTYRTLCVRTCDGYYFPVSFSTTREKFQRDQAICEQMCPATQVKLYYHRVQTEESEDMVAAADDRPYAALPAAFLYRSRGVAKAGSCSCKQGPRNFSVIAGATQGDVSVQSARPAQPAIPKNTWRIDPLVDPETYANLRGGFDRTAQTRLLNGAPGGEIAAEDRRAVRVVGPAFLPDPEGAIDLRAPAPSALQ